MNQSTSSSPHSIQTLLYTLRDESLNLFRQEVKLATAEVSERVSELGRNAIQIAIGGFVAYAGAIILLLGLSDLARALLIQRGVAEEVATWTSRAGLGLLVALIGWIMVGRAKKAISKETLVPDETVQSLKEDKHWAEQKLQTSHE